MRAHLGPPRELAVRRREPARHRAMRILWSVAVLVLGVAGLLWAAVGLSRQRENPWLGVWVAKMIVAGAATAIGVFEFKAPARGRWLLTVALGWTAVMIVVVWW
jgi:hypothetical protein